MNRRGLSLIELVVAMFIASFVSTIVYSMFTTSIALSDTLQGEETVLRRQEVIANELEGRLKETDLNRAVVVGGQGAQYPNPKNKLATDCALAYPSARLNGVFQTDAVKGTPVWQSLDIVYQKAGTQELRLKNVSLAQLGNPDLENPTVLEGIVRVQLASGGGELLAKDMAAVNFNIENVTIVPYPIESDDPQPTDVPGIVHMYAYLFFKDRRGQESIMPSEEQFTTWNSFYSKFPTIYPEPTTTPTPPDSPPIVPEDYNS